MSYLRPSSISCFCCLKSLWLFSFSSRSLFYLWFDLWFDLLFYLLTDCAITCSTAAAAPLDTLPMALGFIFLLSSISCIFFSLNTTFLLGRGGGVCFCV